MRCLQTIHLVLYRKRFQELGWTITEAEEFRFEKLKQDACGCELWLGKIRGILHFYTVVPCGKHHGVGQRITADEGPTL